MSTSIGDLVQRVRWKTNTESNTFVTDQELSAFVNDALAELDDILVGLYEEYKLTSAQLSIASSSDGTNNFALPADFLKARKVERQWGSEWAPLRPFSLQERAGISRPLDFRAGFGLLGYYRIEGALCEVLPWQNASGVYRLWYVPSFTPIAVTVDGNGAFTGAGGTALLPVHMDSQAWHAFATNAAAAMVQQKQDLDAAVFVQERETQRQRVIGAAKSRDAGMAKRVADVRGGGRYGGRGGGWGR